nr:hypothetical protein [Tanacetum cinerariifolium]
MTSFGYRLNPRHAIKECLSCGALYTQNCSCSKGNIEDKILVPKPPKNYARCAKCGHPVNGPYCQGCALLREKLEEDLDHGVKSSQNPPPIDECCCECGNALDGIFCQQCICKSCGKGAHVGYNCPPKVPIISNLEPCNQTMNDEFPQNFPVSVGCQKPGHLAARLGCAETKVATWDDLAFKLITLGKRIRLKRGKSEQKQTKPDKNGKRVEAEKSLKQLQ